MSPRESHPSYGARARSRMVVALGGPVLGGRVDPGPAGTRPSDLGATIANLAPLAHERDLVVTHGTGSALGLAAMDAMNDPGLAGPYPLDALVAETQGLLGYWLAQGLQNAMPDREVVAMTTRTLVSRRDAAFDVPSRFVGPVYPEAQALRLADERGWTVRRDGVGWRRVVPSPTPQGVIEINAIQRLVEHGTVVVCGGGGGIPVTRGPAGELAGVDAVVDKDLTSAAIAEALRAELLLLLTDVPAVSTDHGDPSAATIGHTTPGDLYRRRFSAGSMAPKVEAACRFVERTGGAAAIGSIHDLDAILAGEAGTIVTRDGAGLP